MKRVLITGATGFVGSAIARRLLAEGVSVRALVRERADTRNLAGLDLEHSRGDITDAVSVRKAMSGCDTVFHAAAMVAFWVPVKERQQFYHVNVEGTKIVMRAALDEGVERVVHTSTISTIGSYGEATPTNEEMDFNLWDMCMEYERSKYSAEFEAWRFGARGLPLVVVLPAAPVGPRDIKPNPVGQLILNFIAGKIPGYIDGGANFIHVVDVADGHVLAARKGRPGERYILGDQNLTVPQLFEALETISGVKAPKLKLPYRGALGLAHLLEFVANRITNRHPLLTAPMTKFSSLYYFVDTTKAKSELGFVPSRSVALGVWEALDWLLSNGYVTDKNLAGRVRAHLDQSAGSMRPAAA